MKALFTVPIRLSTEAYAKVLTKFKRERSASHSEERVKAFTGAPESQNVSQVKSFPSEFQIISDFATDS